MGNSNFNNKNKFRKQNKRINHIEMFYLNTIVPLFLFVEQLDQLDVCLSTDWNTNTGSIPKFKVEFR